MEKPQKSEALETELVRQIAAIDTQIAELTSQKTTLQTLLIRVRRENYGNAAVSRRNSVERIVVEDEILRFIRDHDGPTRAGEIFAAVRRANPRMKESTFRSHVHRLKTKGLIRAMGTRGYWVLKD